MTDIDYVALGQTEEEIVLLKEHDKDETLHRFVGVPFDFSDGRPVLSDPVVCKECGDTAEGLMHNNTWRNVEPLVCECGHELGGYPCEVGTLGDGCEN